MDFAYTAADLVISRAGALAIAELCIAAKPVIFVPYPHAAEGHQDANARALEAKHSAVVVNDADAATTLVAALEQLLNNQRECEVLAKNIKSLGVKDADERIAHIVIALAKKGS
jgi:UDP-N-acetylglucosamine--N-acetylmuramyl-(pentapeptide) pyrophosphoryl-undecaprenol N-acetylglucosamine transferase